MRLRNSTSTTRSHPWRASEEGHMLHPTSCVDSSISASNGTQRTEINPPWTPRAASHLGSISDTSHQLRSFTLSCRQKVGIRRPSPAPMTAAVRDGGGGCSESAEGFLDQIITWRELGFNVAVNDPLHHRYESIPDWARTSLEAHAGDKRDGYTFEELEEARTEDEIWNAAQRQLRTDGIIQNYLRMLWGKKISNGRPIRRPPQIGWWH